MDTAFLTQGRQDSVQTLKMLGLRFPSITLSNALCGPGVTPVYKNVMESDFVYKPRMTPSLHRYLYGRARGTEPLTGLTYWQMEVFFVPRFTGSMLERYPLCEIGVSTHQAMLKTGAIAPTPKGAATVRLFKEGCNLKGRITYGNIKRYDAVLADFDPYPNVTKTIGFLMNSAKGNLLIFDVQRSKLLDAFTVSAPAPLYPVINIIHDTHFLNASILVSVESGELLGMSPPMTKFVREMVEAMILPSDHESAKRAAGTV